MKLSTQLMYAGNPRETADQVAALEQAGLDTIWVPEAYGFDSPTLMGYLAAKTERVEIDDLEGRITTSLLTPYPPGIPLLIPGERFNRKIVDYLRFTRQFNAAFPGFDTDVHGLVEKDDEAGIRHYYVDCVRDEV